MLRYTHTHTHTSDNHIHMLDTHIHILKTLHSKCSCLNLKCILPLLTKSDSVPSWLILKHFSGVGQEGGSAGKGSAKFDRLEFNPWDPHSGGEKPVSLSALCPLKPMWGSSASTASATFEPAGSAPSGHRGLPCACPQVWLGLHELVQEMQSRIMTLPWAGSQPFCPQEPGVASLCWAGLCSPLCVGGAHSPNAGGLSNRLLRALVELLLTPQPHFAFKFNFPFFTWLGW